MVGGEQLVLCYLESFTSLRQVLADGEHWHSGLLIPKGLSKNVWVALPENEIELLEMLIHNLMMVINGCLAGVMVYSPFGEQARLPGDIVEKLGDGFDRLPRHLPGEASSLL